jgi:hypothetical protein
MVLSLVAGLAPTTEGTRSGQTRRKPKDLSAREREERGRGEGGGVYVVYRRLRDLEPRFRPTFDDLERKIRSGPFGGFLNLTVHIEVRRNSGLPDSRDRCRCIVLCSVCLPIFFHVGQEAMSVCKATSRAVSGGDTGVGF